MNFLQIGIPYGNPVSIEKYNRWSRRGYMVWNIETDYVEDYKIRVTFNNGESGTIDLKDVIYDDKRPIFRELVDITEFRQFEVDFGTIVWKNCLDVAPEFLYSFLVQSQHAK
jgi:hypothetical protein